MKRIDPYEAEPYLRSTYPTGVVVASPGATTVALDPIRCVTIYDLVQAGIFHETVDGYVLAPPESLVESNVREAAMERVRGEMRYADKVLKSPRSDQSRKSHIEHIALIEACIIQAKIDFYTKPGQDLVGDQMRKIAALAIRSIEQNGCPKRIDHPKAIVADATDY